MKEVKVLKNRIHSLLCVGLAFILLAGCGAGTVGSGTQGNSNSMASVPASSQTEATSESLSSKAAPVAPSIALEHQTGDSGAPAVFMTTDISPEGLMSAYEALEWTPVGKVAVKLSTGEPPASNYLDPSLIKNVVQLVGGTIVECNTAYGGSRAETAMHRQVAEDHGFTAIAEVDIMDEEGSIPLTVTGGKHLTENLVGSHFANYDSFLVLSHFKGHAMAGFGGAVKNISIGIASQSGKSRIHTAGASDTSPWGGEQNPFTESMAEAGKSVSDSLNNGENIVYINVMNHLSIDCDCDGNPSEPDIHDIGILASHDPVALDQACVDLINVAEGNETFVARMAERNACHVLEHGEKIGLGSRAYRLVDLDA